MLDQMRQILDKFWKHNLQSHHMFIDFKVSVIKRFCILYEVKVVNLISLVAFFLGSLVGYTNRRQSSGSKHEKIIKLVQVYNHHRGVCVPSSYLFSAE